MTTLNLKLTALGAAKIISQRNAGLALSLSKWVFGTGQYTPAVDGSGYATQTALTTPFSPALETGVGGRRRDGHTLRLLGRVTLAVNKNVGELGVLDSDGILIFVGSQPSASGWLIPAPIERDIVLDQRVIVGPMLATVTLTLGNMWLTDASQSLHIALDVPQSPVANDYYYFPEGGPPLYAETASGAITGTYPSAVAASPTRVYAYLGTGQPKILAWDYSLARQASDDITHGITAHADYDADMVVSGDFLLLLVNGTLRTYRISTGALIGTLMLPAGYADLKAMAYDGEHLYFGQPSTASANAKLLAWLGTPGQSRDSSQDWVVAANAGDGQGARLSVDGKDLVLVREGTTAHAYVSTARDSKYDVTLDSDVVAIAGRGDRLYEATSDSSSNVNIKRYAHAADSNLNISLGTGDQSTNELRAVCTDGDGNIYTINKPSSGDCKIYKRAIASGTWSEFGTLDTLNADPVSMEVSGDEILVLDGADKTVYAYSLSDFTRLGTSDIVLADTTRTPVAIAEITEGDATKMGVYYRGGENVTGLNISLVTEVSSVAVGETVIYGSGHTGQTSALAFNTNGTRNSGKDISNVASNASAEGMSLNAEETKLYVGDRNTGNVNVFDTSTKSKLSGESFDTPYSISSLAVSGDTIFIGVDNSKTIYMYDRVSKTQVGSFTASALPSTRCDLMAVTAGVIYLGSNNNSKVVAYTPSGAYIGDFRPSGISGHWTGASIQGNTLYILKETNAPRVLYAYLLDGHIDRYTDGTRNNADRIDLTSLGSDFAQADSHLYFAGNGGIMAVTLDGTHDSNRDVTYASGNGDPVGIAADSGNLYVGDDTDNILYGYAPGWQQVSSHGRPAAADNIVAAAVTDTHLYLVDGTDRKAYALKLSDMSNETVRDVDVPSALTGTISDAAVDDLNIYFLKRDDSIHGAVLSTGAALSDTITLTGIASQARGLYDDENLFVLDTSDSYWKAIVYGWRADPTADITVEASTGTEWALTGLDWDGRGDQFVAVSAADKFLFVGADGVQRKSGAIGDAGNTRVAHGVTVGTPATGERSLFVVLAPSELRRYHVVNRHDVFEYETTGYERRDSIPIPLRT